MGRFDGFFRGPEGFVRDRSSHCGRHLDRQSSVRTHFPVLRLLITKLQRIKDLDPAWKMSYGISIGKDKKLRVFI